MNVNINLESDSSVSNVQNSDVSKTSQKGDPNIALAPKPRNPDKPLPKKSGLKSGGPVQSASNEPSINVDEIEDSAMDTSGCTRKRKPTMIKILLT